MEQIPQVIRRAAKGKGMVLSAEKVRLLAGEFVVMNQKLAVLTGLRGVYRDIIEAAGIDPDEAVAQWQERHDKEGEEE